MDILYKYQKYLSNHAESTQKNYMVSIKIYLEYLEKYKGKRDIITICNIKKGDIFNFIAYLEGKSKGTIRNRLCALKSFYSHINPLISKELFEDIKLFNSYKKLPKILNMEEIKRLLNYYDSTRNRLIIYLFLQTGIRLSELANIKLKDIDLKEQFIRIIGKGGTERQVYISNRSKQEIVEYIEKENPKEYLFGIKKRAIQYIVTSAMKKLNIEGSTHTLRHTIATLMYEQTQDILLVKEFLGHKSIESTQIYTHISNKMVKEAVEKNPLANM